MKKINLLIATPLLSTVAALPIAMTSCSSTTNIDCAVKTRDCYLVNESLSIDFFLTLTKGLESTDTLSIVDYKIGTSPVSGNISFKLSPSYTSATLTFKISNAFSTETSGTIPLSIQFQCTNKSSGTETVSWTQWLTGLVVRFTKS